MFTSNLLHLFYEHNMKFPDNLFDDSDFVPKLFQFLNSYGINPPEKEVPKFKVKAHKFPPPKQDLIVNFSEKQQETLVSETKASENETQQTETTKTKTSPVKNPEGEGEEELMDRE
jgi:hypothetical protein